MSEWREQEVANEMASREINEITYGNRDHAAALAILEFVCECSDGTCAATISMRGSDYEAVRAEGATFTIAPGHESPEIDMLMIERPRFSIVRKLPGFAARQALDADPRRRVGAG